MLAIVAGGGGGGGGAEGGDVYCVGLGKRNVLMFRLEGVQRGFVSERTSGKS